MVPNDGNNILYISSFEDTQARVHVPSLTHQPERSYPLSAGGIRIITLSGNTRTGGSTGLEKKKGIRITADKPMSVQGLTVVNETSVKTNEGFLGLPVDALGTKYIAPAFHPVINAIIQVVAKEDNTSVSFNLRLPQNGRVQYQDNYYYNGDVISVNLNDLDVFQVLADQDLSGTVVTSSKPIAVFSGDDCTTVPLNYFPCNHLVEQIPPVSHWGSLFITNPTPNNPGGDVFHVIASAPNARVSVDSQYKTTLNQGEKYMIDHAPWNKSLVIKTSQPSLVVQYSSGGKSPSMNLVPPLKWFANDYTIYVPQDEQGNFDSHVNVIIETSLRSDLRVAGADSLVINWTSIPGSGGFSRASLHLTKGGRYHVYHKNPLKNFSAVVYGMSSLGLFAIPAGLKSTQPSGERCSRTKTVGGDNIDNDCDGRTDEEAANEVDDDGDGNIDEDLVTPEPTFNVPKDYVTTPLLSCDRTSSVANIRNTGIATGSAQGVCAIRGKATISYKDNNVNNQECEREFDRVWTIKDSCQNTITRNQRIKINAPQDPTIIFPDDVSFTCRENYLDPEFTGEVVVTAKLCPRNVTISYQDGYRADCSDKEVKLERAWTVKDKCAPSKRKTQVITLLPKGERIQLM